VVPDAHDGPPRSLLIAAVAIAVGAVVAVLVVAVVRQGGTPQQPVAIASAPAPQADSNDCRALSQSLPDDLADYHRATAAEPAPAGAAAWRSESGDTIVLRCGLDRPADFVVGAPIQAVDAVQWFRVGDADLISWFAVDRPVYVALTLPAGTGPTPIQVMSEIIAKTLPAKPIDPGPPR
jgi:hypothetical protein